MKDKKISEACFVPVIPKQAKEIYEFLTYCMTETADFGGMDGGIKGLNKSALTTVAQEWGISTKQYRYYIKHFESEMTKQMSRQRERQKSKKT